MNILTYSVHVLFKMSSKVRGQRMKNGVHKWWASIGEFPRAWVITNNQRFAPVLKVSRSCWIRDITLTILGPQNIDHESHITEENKRRCCGNRLEKVSFHFYLKLLCNNSISDDIISITQLYPIYIELTLCCYTCTTYKMNEEK